MTDVSRTEANPQPTVGLVLVVRDEAAFLGANLAYHHALGVRRGYVYLDRSRDGSGAIARSFPWVEAIERDRRPEERHMAVYQTRCMADALERARRDGVEWLLHLDADEFGRGDDDGGRGAGPRAEGASLGRMLAACRPETEAVVLRTLEAVPVPLPTGAPFHELTAFQARGALRRRILDPRSGTVRLLRHRLGHSKGKSAVRTSAAVVPASAHRWRAEPGGRRLRTENRGCHYHFVVVDADHWLRKYRKLAEYPARWRSGRPVRFPKQAWKEAATAMTPDDARAYFREWVCVHPRTLLWSRLTGRVVRDTFVADVLSGLDWPRA